MADLELFDADPDPTFHADADPDPAAEPDTDKKKMLLRRRKKKLGTYNYKNCL